LAGSATENVSKLSFASERMYAAEHSQLRRLVSSDDSNRRRSVATPITVLISATQSRTPDVDTEEMLNNRRSPSPHETSRNFTLTGTNYCQFPVTLLV